jgi:hypothetical protein
MWVDSPSVINQIHIGMAKPYPNCCNNSKCNMERDENALMKQIQGSEVHRQNHRQHPFTKTVLEITIPPIIPPIVKASNPKVP